MTTSPLGIGIIGAGFIAESHAQAAAGHPGLRMVAVFDRNPAAATALAARYGAATVPYLDALLADPGVDIVVLGTPNDTHAELAVRIAEAGRASRPVSTWASRLVLGFQHRLWTPLPSNHTQHQSHQESFI